MVKKFKQYTTTNIGIIIKNALIEVYYFISIIEYYYRLLHLVYFIIITKIPSI